MKFAEASPGWQKSQSSLVDLISLARARSIRTIVIPYPLPSGLREQPYPFQFYIDAVSRTAKAAGAECLDVIPILQDGRKACYLYCCVESKAGSSAQQFAHQGRAASEATAAAV